MASVTGQDFINVMNLPAAFTATMAEYVLDMAIDTLNLYGCSIDNMAGSAGSKTVTLTSQQRGGVFHTARAIYFSFFKDISATNLSSVSLTIADLASNPTVMATIKEAAKLISKPSGTSIPFVVAEDTSGYT